MDKDAEPTAPSKDADAPNVVRKALVGARHEDKVTSSPKLFSSPKIGRFLCNPTQSYVNAVRIQATLQTALTLVSNTRNATMSDYVDNELQMEWIDWNDWLEPGAVEGDARFDW